MRSTRKLIAPLVASAFALALAPGVWAQAPSTLASPDDVKTGLRILNQVVGHTGRLIASKNYDTVPREHHEIVEGAEILRDALAKDPKEFRDTIDAMLDKVVDASSALAPPSAKHDDAALAAAHTRLADAVHAVLDEFPASLQPMPRN